jgi:tetratricopeptide (TPR) repeat protein
VAPNSFGQNDTIELSGKDAKKLTLIQNRLNLLFGEAQQVLDRMDGFNWQSGERESADVLQQWGDALFVSGDREGALGRYEDAIHVLSDFSSQLIFLHHKRGQMFIEQAETNAAKREIQLAEFELERFKGLMELTLGDYLKAQEHLKIAKELAQTLNDDARIAKSNQLLAITIGNYGDILQAHEFAAEAMAYFQRVGNRLQLEGLRAELAGFYLNVGRFAESIEPGKEIIMFWTSRKALQIFSSIFPVA